MLPTDHNLVYYLEYTTFLKERENKTDVNHSMRMAINK